jgi:nitronate monooxygenase
VTIPPIVLAPLAGGPSTPALAAAVSGAGGLGFVAAGYLDAAELDRQLRATRSLTGAPIGANLFVLRERPVDQAGLASYARELEPEAAARGVQLGDPRFDDDGLAAKLDVLAEAGVEFVSTTFGCLAAGEISRLHGAGSDVWATVTSVDEARSARDAGADALVVQGAEAGGHRGSWDDREGDDVPLLELLRLVRSEVGLPLVATGGIATREGVRSAVAAGAEAAQIGTAFLLAREAGTSTPHRRALGRPGETAITRAFTGRRARGIVNRFMRDHPTAPAAYPHVHHLTAPLRAAARAAGDTDAINLWAGTRFAEALDLSAAEIVARLRP